jgi:hypothetical protein
MYELGIGVSFGLFAFIFAYLSSKNNAENSPLQWLFLFAALIYMAVGTFLMWQIAGINSLGAVQEIIAWGGLNLMIIILLITIAYFMLVFISTAAQSMMEKRKREG